MEHMQGIVTLEDLFEEMLFLEIHDEHDTRLVDSKEERVNERSKVWSTVDNLETCLCEMSEVDVVFAVVRRRTFMTFRQSG